MRVRVYRNLHKNCFSIQHKTPKGWRLWGHATKFYVKNAVFKVSESGRQRVLKERRKNVHAFIEGDFYSVTNTVPYKSVKYAIVYNPYINRFFYNNEGEDVFNEDIVYFKENKCYSVI